MTSAPSAVNWADGTTPGPKPNLAAWLEPVYFMMGASYFNAKDWPNSISVLTEFLKLFPDSVKATEVRFSLAQAEIFGDAPDKAIPALKNLIENPIYHDRCVLLLVDAEVKTHDLPGAINVEEAEKHRPQLNERALGKINLKLVSLYLDTAALDKAMAVLQEMDGDINQLTDVTDFNAMAARLGDALLEANRVADALNCYGRVRGNDQVFATETQEIENLNKDIADNLIRIRAAPLNSSDLQALNKELQSQVDKNTVILGRAKSLPPILPPLLLRIGRAYSKAGQQWEAAVVYRELLRRFPNVAESEAALYGSIVIFEQAKQTDRAQVLCQQYLNSYPQGKYADTVAYLRGVLAYDAGTFDQAITYFKAALAVPSSTSRHEQIEIVLGDVALRQQKFDDAIAAYNKYLADFPQGSRTEQAVYRKCLALLFGAKYDQADVAFQAYESKYPAGAYRGDSAYRRAVIKFASKNYNAVLVDGEAWQKKYGNEEALADVQSLMGDCYSSLGRMDEAVTLYQQSYKNAHTDEVVSYSLFGAAKILQKEANWPEIDKMFREFILANPESKFVVSAVSWVGRAEIKLGRVEDAKQFMAASAKQYLNDPAKEDVDQIITQLAQVYLRRSPVAISGAGAGVAQTGTAPPNDPAQELVDILTVAELDKKPTASMRVLFARAEVARLQKKLDAEQQCLSQIGDKFKPEDLSPALLGQVGDYLVFAGHGEQAAELYLSLLDNYKDSPSIDFAYNGLGQIAYEKGDYQKADGYYQKALDLGVGTIKLKEITLGEARTLLALKRYDEAKSLFEEVASNRAWRGEATAVSVFSLGEIQMEQDRFAAANAYFQRVFVAYQKYPPIQAKAYLGSGEAFEKLGQIHDAANTYEEMLRNPNLTSFPEAATAKQRLENLAQK